MNADKSMQQSTIQCVNALADAYPDIPVEVIFKEDLLRQGMAWSPEALEIAAEFKRKAYFICSFDMVPISEMGLCSQRVSSEPHDAARSYS